MVHTFRRAEAVFLAPSQYLELIDAKTYGIVLFRDFIYAITWLGIAIFVVSGIYAFRRERVLARNPR